MTENDLLKALAAELVEEDMELTLADLCRACQLPAERVFELVDEGVIEPLGREPARWRFRAVSVRRVRCVQRLERDLGVNVAGARNDHQGSLAFRIRGLDVRTGVEQDAQ